METKGKLNYSGGYQELFHQRRYYYTWLLIATLLAIHLCVFLPNGLLVLGQFILGHFYPVYFLTDNLDHFE